MKFFATLTVAVLAAGCGYLSSGEWIDDAGNWDRAFHSAKPDDVVVVHSLFSENQLRQATGAELDDDERPCFGACPSWFVPGALGEYEVWQYADGSNSRFRIFIEKKTGRLFLGDFGV